MACPCLTVPGGIVSALFSPNSLTMNKLLLKTFALCYLVLIGNRCFTSFPS